MISTWMKRESPTAWQGVLLKLVVSSSRAAVPTTSEEPQVKAQYSYSQAAGDPASFSNHLAGLGIGWRF
jgi:hypothetical protein